MPDFITKDPPEYALPVPVACRNRIPSDFPGWSSRGSPGRLTAGKARPPKTLIKDL